MDASASRPDGEILSPGRVEADYELEPRTIRAAFNAGELHAAEVKRKLYVDRRELERWIKSKETTRK